MKMKFISLVSCLIISNLYAAAISSNTLIYTSDAQTSSRSTGMQVQLDQAVVQKLKNNSEVEVLLPSGKVVTGVMSNSVNDANQGQGAVANQTSRDILSLKNQAGSLELLKTGNKVSGMMLIDSANEKIYRAQLDANGNGVLIEQDNDDHYCVKFPETNSLRATNLPSAQALAATPDISTLRNLQSRAGSEKVLYINYWGGSLSNTYWNANYTNNAPINFTPYDVDGNTGNFSSNERYLMWLAWREAAEDFAPFDINITTSSSVYNATPIANRAQMIVTTTQDWFSNSAGGVALVDIFDDNSNYYKSAWTWNLGDSSMGMTISHEAGHQLGLHHDGTASRSYYSGHGVWGPIMGAPFGKPYVQWSKGDYPGANQNENDINLINNYLNLVSDEAGNNFQNAKNVTLPVNNVTRLTGFQDSDVYKFTVNSSNPVQISVIPLLGDEDENRAGNLAMDVSLSKITPSGTLISNIASIDSADNSPLRPSTNKFEYSNNLAAGTYAVKITPSSPDTNWSTGFDNYANAGEYRLSIDGASSGINLTGKPAIDQSTESGVFVWRDNNGRTFVKVVAGDAAQNGEFTNFSGSVTAAQSISSLNPISIEIGNSSRHDELTQANANQVNFDLNVARPFQDSFSFLANVDESLCLDLSQFAGGLFLGPDKVEVNAPYDLNLQESCDGQSIQVVGEPNINNSVDHGIFLWRDDAGVWFTKVVAGDGFSIVGLNVNSQKNLTQYAPIRLEASDIVSVQPKSIDATLRLGPPGQDGFRFRNRVDSNTCLSTTSSMSIFVGPDKTVFNGDFNLNSLSNCQ